MLGNKPQHVKWQEVIVLIGLSGYVCIVKNFVTQPLLSLIVNQKVILLFNKISIFKSYFTLKCQLLTEPVFVPSTAFYSNNNNKLEYKLYMVLEVFNLITQEADWLMSVDLRPA